mgnify:CR=1 FL=1|jgi:four helix bundle protein
MPNTSSVDNIIVQLSRDYAIRCINLFKFLNKNKEYVMAKQILRCGTSIGANISESVFAQSRSDFVSKLSIALKEARENQYWLDLLHATEYIDDVSFKSMNDDCNKIIGTLVKIIKTTKNKFEKDDKS